MASSRKRASTGIAGAAGTTFALPLTAATTSSASTRPPVTFVAALLPTGTGTRPNTCPRVTRHTTSVTVTDLLFSGSSSAARESKHDTGGQKRVSIMRRFHDRQSFPMRDDPEMWQG